MKRTSLSCLLCFAFSTDVFAWGAEGHSIVAEIAQRHMSPIALANVRWLLKGEVSLASIASWSDDVRPDRPATYNWHFVDIPLNQSTYDPATQCAPNPDKGDCVINEIGRARATLADVTASTVDRVEALKHLVHFVGDVHQPLHTVADNTGENTLHVTFYTDPTTNHQEKTNLHAVWDSGLIRHLYWDWGAYVNWIESDWLPGKDLDALESGTAVDWALEAHQVAIESAVKGVAENQVLDNAYVAQMRPQLDRQLAVAGLRLARILNEALR